MTDKPEQAVENFTKHVAGTQEDPVAGLDTTIKWQMVWLEAIAMAWRDPKFKAELLEDPRKALRGYFNFDLGPYAKLTVREATAPEMLPVHAPSTHGHGHGHTAAHSTRLVEAFGGWDPARDPLQSEMIMALPPAPRVEDQAVALSFYNASGRAYPFTCC